MLFLNDMNTMMSHQQVAIRQARKLELACLQAIQYSLHCHNDMWGQCANYNFEIIKKPCNQYSKFIYLVWVQSYDLEDTKITSPPREKPGACHMNNKTSNAPIDNHNKVVTPISTKKMKQSKCIYRNKITKQLKELTVMLNNVLESKTNEICELTDSNRKQTGKVVELMDSNTKLHQKLTN